MADIVILPVTPSPLEVIASKAALELIRDVQEQRSRRTDRSQTVVDQLAKPYRLKPEGAAMKYTVILEREADGGFVASVPVLPGCVSQGDDRADALRNIREAVKLYVEDCRASGDAVPEEDSLEYFELLTGTR